MSLLKEHSTTEVLTNGRISGYVYAHAIENGVQRLEWVLFEDFKYVNHAPMTLRAVTDVAWRHDTLDGFVAHVEQSHGPNARWTFCHARASMTVHTQARTYALQPGLSPDDFQLEAGKNIAVLTINDSVMGVCYARTQNTASYPVVEYWNLSAACPAAPDGTFTVKELDTEVAVSIARTIKIENRYDQELPQV